MSDSFTAKKDKKDFNHTGVLKYIQNETKHDNHEHFYGNALDKAFYEMYVLEAWTVKYFFYYIIFFTQFNKISNFISRNSKQHYYTYIV